jgi:signal transduction histidine kinase
MIDFLMTDSGRTFTPEDLEVSNRLGVLGALALENARLYRETRDQARARENFVAVASHELRQPIHVLNLQLALLRGEKGGGKREDAIERQLGQMRRLVDDLLDVARVGAGTLSLQHSDVNLSSIASEVVSQLTPEAQRRNITLTLDAPPSLPCFTDRTRVEQILTNLVSNALKYGANRPVTVQLIENGASAVLNVSDRGPGVPVDERARIFERFRRRPEHESLPDGSGLGLWIVREIAHAMEERFPEIARGQPKLVARHFTEADKAKA